MTIEFEVVPGDASFESTEVRIFMNEALLQTLPTVHSSPQGQAVWPAGVVVNPAAIYSALVVVDPGLQSETIGHRAEIPLGFVDLRIRTSARSSLVLPEQNRSPPNEEDPGAIVGRNTDDDDNNKTRDMEEPNDRDVIGEDDLVPVDLFVDAEKLGLVQVLLEVTTGSDKIKIWSKPTRGQLVGPTRLWYLNRDDEILSTVYVEGISNSTHIGDVEIQLKAWEVPGQAEPHTDMLRITVVETDLDIDSDNNDAMSVPDRDDDEDKIEDVWQDATKPGKFVVANINDDDRDYIPDFADGFNRDAAEPDPEPEDDANVNDSFVPLILELSKAIDVSRAKVRFTYSDSDPARVIRSGFEPEFIYIPEAGHLRIWKVDGNVPRNPMSIGAATPGHFVPSGEEFTPQQLGLTETQRSVTLYAEGVAASNQVADQQIVMEVDPDGTGHLGFDVQDETRVTVVKIELVDQAPLRGIIGGYIAWITGEPRMPQLRARIEPNLGATDPLLARWSLKTEYDRSRVHDMPSDEVFVPRNEPQEFRSLRAEDEWHIADEIDTGLPEELRIYGGESTLKLQVVSAVPIVFEQELQFRIRGRNPDDDNARTFIQNIAGAPWYAYAIARKESLQNDDRYNQFNEPIGAYPWIKGTPNWGYPDGWGMFQTDSASGFNIEVRHLWNWQENSELAITILTGFVTAANTYMQQERARARLDNGGVDVAVPDWPVGNCLFSDNGPHPIEDAVAMKMYNGGFLADRYVRWDSTTNSWEFNTVVWWQDASGVWHENDYVAGVCQEVE